MLVGFAEKDIIIQVNGKNQSFQEIFDDKPGELQILRKRSAKEEEKRKNPFKEDLAKIKQEMQEAETKYRETHSHTSSSGRP
jgi:hypothetical protein